jgi:hypothetical protein
MEFYEDFSTGQVAVLRSGHRFEIPAFPDTTGSTDEIRTMATVVWSTVDSNLSKVLEIRADKRYSDLGRAEKIDPISDLAYLRLVGAHGLAADIGAKLDVRERELIGVPQIAPGNTPGQLEDKEVREWWARQKTDARTRYMELAKNGDPDAVRMALAILRSPVPQADLEKRFFRDVWETSCRVANPVESEAINLGRQALQWMEKNLAFATVVTQKVFESVPRERTLRFLLGMEDAFRP